MKERDSETIKDKHGRRGFLKITTKYILGFSAFGIASLFGLKRNGDIRLGKMRNYEVGLPEASGDGQCGYGAGCAGGGGQCGYGAGCAGSGKPGGGGQCGYGAGCAGGGGQCGYGAGCAGGGGQCGYGAGCAGS